MRATMTITMTILVFLYSVCLPTFTAVNVGLSPLIVPWDRGLKTIKEKYWRTFSAILEMKTILEDVCIHTVGGIKAGLEMWELA